MTISVVRPHQDVIVHLSEATYPDRSLVSLQSLSMLICSNSARQVAISRSRICFAPSVYSSSGTPGRRSFTTFHAVAVFMRSFSNSSFSDYGRLPGTRTDYGRLRNFDGRPGFWGRSIRPIAPSRRSTNVVLPNGQPVRTCSRISRKSSSRRRCSIGPANRQPSPATAQRGPSGRRVPTNGVWHCSTASRRIEDQTGAAPDSVPRTARGRK